MVDVVSSIVRSRIMAKIQGKNTKAEVMIRKALFKEGFRYRLYVKNLPGKPDLVFPKYKAVVFINGCFWHGHDCYLFKWPSTNSKFWHEKISSNSIRDKQHIIELEKLGWRVLTIWECSFRGKYMFPFQELISKIRIWLTTNQATCEITHK